MTSILITVVLTGAEAEKAAVPALPVTLDELMDPGQARSMLGVSGRS